MNSEITIVWLRNDLRLEDNPALYHANEYAKKNNSCYFFLHIHLHDIEQGYLLI